MIGLLEVLAGVLLLGAACFGAGFAVGVTHGPMIRARRRRAWSRSRGRRPGTVTTRTPW